MLVYSVGLSDMGSLKLKGTKTLKVDSWDQLLKSLDLVGLYLHPLPRRVKPHTTHSPCDPLYPDECHMCLHDEDHTLPKTAKSGVRPSPKRARKPVSKRRRKAGRGT